MAAALTWVIPAASCSGAPPPVPIHLGEFPLLVAITGEGVGGQVADLQAGIVPQEVTERHPGKSRDTGILGCGRTHWLLALTLCQGQLQPVKDRQRSTSGLNSRHHVQNQKTPTPVLAL